MDKIKNFPSNFINDEVFFIKLMFYYFKLSGVATINLNIQPRKRFDRRKIWFTSTSNFDLIPNVILIFLLALLSYLQLKKNVYHSVSGDKTVKNNVTIVVCTLSFLLSLFTIKVILLKYCFQRKNIVNVIDKINALCVSSATIGRETISTKKNMNFFNDVVQLFLIYVVYVFSLIVRITINVINNDELLNCVVPLIFIVILDATVIQYNVFLCVIKKYVVLIKKELLLNNPENFVTCVYDFQKKTTKLYQVHKFYVRLRKISQDLSSFYSLPMLLIIVYVIVTTTIDIFSIIKGFTIPEMKQFDYKLNFVSIVVHLILLRKLTKIVSSIVFEVIEKFICKVINKKRKNRIISFFSDRQYKTNRQSMFEQRLLSRDEERGNNYLNS